MQKITDLRTHNIAYDYESVMHYSRWQCNYDLNGHQWFTNKYQGRKKDDMGKYTRLPAKDVQHVTAEYCSSMIAKSNTNNYVLIF